MSLLAIPRTTCWKSFSSHLSRGYASASSSKPNPTQPPKTSEPAKRPDIVSSCPAGAVMTGLNYLKGEPPVLAKPDEEYPSWLWDLTKPKVLADDGPGGKAEKQRLRLSHRQALKDSNLFKVK